MNITATNHLTPPGMLQLFKLVKIQMLANLLIIKDFRVQYIKPSISSQKHCEESIRRLSSLSISLRCNFMAESHNTTREIASDLRSFYGPFVTGRM